LQGKPVYVNGVNQDDDNSLSSSIKDVFLKSTDNLSWLSRGDVVLLKPALNSSDSYPATTHPFSIHVISKILAENGAKVIIGDQSGIADVLHHLGGVIRGNTRQNYINAGMGTGHDEFVSFEEGGWDEGFSHYLSDHTSSWPNGFFITNWIHKADHIINLPRLSAHSQAGATLGFKNMVGILRDDSRMDFHANGPYNFSIKLGAWGSTLKSVDDKSDTFIEKIVEINDAIKEKLRLTLFVATRSQATFGPNRNVIAIGKYGILKSKVVTLNPGLVFGSADPVAAESFALALLKNMRKSLPFLSKLSQRLILFSNRNVRDLDKVSVQNNLYISHAMAIGLGKMPSNIKYTNVPQIIQNSLKQYYTDL
jgi:uncharacterized protein (DUF362 family)